MEVIDMNIPSDSFVKLGCDSLEGVSNKFLRRRSSEYLRADYLREGDLNLSIDPEKENKLIRLCQIDDETTTLGIDTSNIVLGNTEEGILCAVRGTVVWKEKATYQYLRYGPFIFHITERNKYALYNTLRRAYLDVDDGVGVPILERTVERIRSILERWLQSQLCEATCNSLILWDGSLTTRTVNNTISGLSEILHTARKNHNCILAFSKKTTLSVGGRRFNDLIDGRFAPCLLDIDKDVQMQYSGHLHFLGRIYVAKFSSTSFAFRLDIDRRVSEDEGLNAVGKLLGNELLACLLYTSPSPRDRS